MLIEYKRTEIHNREVNRQLWWKKLILRHCYLELEPKFTNFNGIRASATSNHVAKTASKSVHPFGWNIVYWQTRHTYIDKLQWKYKPSTVSWRCKKLQTKLIRFRNLQVYSIACLSVLVMDKTISGCKTKWNKRALSAVLII